MKWTAYIMVFIVLISGCQDALEDRYRRPGQSDPPTIDNLFTRMLDDNRVRPSYWEVSTMVNWHIGVYSQTVGYLNTEFIYQQNEQYIQERWNDFYRPSANGAGVMAQYREMERLYAATNAAERASWDVYMYAARIVLLDQATRLVDLWGDIPFSEAGMLSASGEVRYPRFDDGASVYRHAIRELEVTSDALAQLQLTSMESKGFVQQDILLHGDIARWQRYANALRLRMLMRISGADSDTVKNAIVGMLADQARFPLPGDDGQYVPGQDDVLLKPLATYSGDLHAAFRDWTNYPAPHYLLEQVLKPVDDPRIQVLFDKYGAYSGTEFSPNESYSALPVTESVIDQESKLSRYAVFDSTTFLFNNQLPGVLMTVAEVDFLRAEAYIRWGGGDAASAYAQGVKHSIQFYYYLNATSNQTKRLPALTDQQLTAFVSRPDVALPESTAGSLARIWTQKWAHFGFLQAYDAWAEQRRTNHPRFEFRPSVAPGNSLPPMRLTYPLSEKTYNPHYADVASRDQRSTKVFWDVN